MLQMSHDRSQNHAQRLGRSFASHVEAWADFARLADWLSSPALAHRAGGPRDDQQRLRMGSYIVFGAGKSSGLKGTHTRRRPTNRKLNPIHAGRNFNLEDTLS